MKKVVRMRTSPTNGSEEMSNSPSVPTQSPNSSNEPMVRTTGRIKKPKAVFDPSDNYLPRAQRLSSFASTTSTSQHTNQASSSLERRASYSKTPNISPVASTESTTVLAKDVCVSCKKRESKRPALANKNRMISCLDCEKKVHKLCLKVEFDDLELLQLHYKCDQCANCRICEKTFNNPDEEMITCSKCVKSYHIKCFPTKIIKMETNLRNWKCNKCQVYNQMTNGTTLPVKKIREIIGGGEPDTPTSPTKLTTIKSIKTCPDSNINNDNSLSPLKRSHGADNNESIKSEDSLNNSGSPSAEKRAKSSNNQSADTISLDTHLSLNTQTKSDSTNLCYSPTGDIPDVKEWSVDQVYEYFAKHFPKEAHVFKDEEIDGRSLLLLKRSDVVKKLPIKLGPSLRIYSLILKIQAQLNDPTLGWNCGL